MCHFETAGGAQAQVNPEQEADTATPLSCFRVYRS